jgi:predicted DNA-binding transcriptional regulator YafY
MEGIIKRAIEENIPLEMIYLSMQNQITKRKIKVYEMKEKYIVGYCFLRKQIRIFKKDRILAALPEKINNHHYRKMQKSKV